MAKITKQQIIENLIKMGWQKEHLEKNDELINDIISTINYAPR